MGLKFIISIKRRLKKMNNQSRSSLVNEIIYHVQHGKDLNTLKGIYTEIPENVLVMILKSFGKKK